MDSRGWIPIPLIASFNRVRQLTTDAQLVMEVLTLSSLVQVRGDMVRMGGWEQYVLPDAPLSVVESESSEEQRQQLQYEQHQHQHPHEIAGSALWQGTHYDAVAPLDMRSGGGGEDESSSSSLLDKNGGIADDGRPLVNGHSVYPSSSSAAAATAAKDHHEEFEEEEDEEEEEDVVFVMGHEVGTTWSPERRT